MGGSEPWLVSGSARTAQRPSGWWCVPAYFIAGRSRSGSRMLARSIRSRAGLSSRAARRLGIWRDDRLSDLPGGAGSGEGGARHGGAVDMRLCADLWVYRAGGALERVVVPARQPRVMLEVQQPKG